MTYENCLKYFEEAEDEKVKSFWRERMERKYPNLVKAKVEEPKPKKEKKK